MSNIQQNDPFKKREFYLIYASFLPNKVSESAYIWLKIQFMKLIKGTCIVILLGLTIQYSFAQTELKGVFYNSIKTPIDCSCAIQKYLSYVKEDGTKSLMTLCFDTEPGDYYEIFDNETITVVGDIITKTCGNGKNYLVLNVQKSTMEPNNRMLQYPEALKELNNTNNPKTPITKELTASGNYLSAYSTKDDWSKFNNCTNCGRLGNDYQTIYNFDRIATYPTGFDPKIQVWGTKEGNTFYVSKWKKL